MLIILSRLRKKRGWSCCLRGDRGEGVKEVEGEVGEAGTLGITLWKYVVISV